MRTGIVACVLASVFLLGTVPAVAQDTIAIYADFGEDDDLVRSLTTKAGEPFDIVVVAKTDHDGGLIQFQMTELQNLYAGVFKYTTTRVGDHPVLAGDEDTGEQVFGFGSCEAAGEHEAVRIRYQDVDGSLPDNVVLSVGNLTSGVVHVRDLGAQMGYVDCDDSTEYVLAPEPWDTDSGMDPSLIDGVDSTDGICVLNPMGLSVPTSSSSIGLLKARF